MTLSLNYVDCALLAWLSYSTTPPGVQTPWPQKYLYGESLCVPLLLLAQMIWANSGACRQGITHERDRLGRVPFGARGQRPLF